MKPAAERVGENWNGLNALRPMNLEKPVPPSVIKVCGITRFDDARAAIDCGANALGFVFWPESPRFIEPDRARAIVRKLPPFVTTVGVFVDQPVAYITDVTGIVRLGAVQLHGGETPETARLLDAPVVKAISGEAVMRGVDQWDDQVLLLVDAHDPLRRGGTGQRADWNAAKDLARRRRLLLAGGLTPENVAEAVELVRPFGIDVSSGVERAPGIKDHVRVRALFEAIGTI
jgi:phosphoribosylanthranilate isomerase